MRRVFFVVAALGFLSAASGCYLVCGKCDCDPPGGGYGLGYAAGVGAPVAGQPAPLGGRLMPQAEK